MEIPDIRYARSGDVAIAHQVVGAGPPDLVFVRAYASDLLSTWEQPLLVRHVLGLAEFARVLMLDKRGTGLSDRVREVQTLETRMDDLRAVMDDAGIERATFSGQSGSPLPILFAATYPERTYALLLLEPMVRGTWSPDYPWAPTEDEWRQRLAEIRDGWGRRDFFVRLLHEWAPDAPEDEEFLDWFITHLRRSLSPGAAVALFRTTMESDVSSVRTSLNGSRAVVSSPCQTCVVHTRGLTTPHTSSSCGRVRGSPPAWDRSRGKNASSRRSSSRTSWARRGGRRSSGTRRGGTCSPVTTPSYVGSWLGTGGRSSTPPVTASSPPSTAPAEPLPARGRSVMGYGISDWRSGWECTRASANAWTASWAVSRSPSERVLPRRRSPERSSRRGRCVISWRARPRVEDRGEHELTGVPGRWRLYAVADA